MLKMENHMENLIDKLKLYSNIIHEIRTINDGWIDITFTKWYSDGTYISALINSKDENTFIVSCWAGAVWLIKLNGDSMGEKKLLLDTRNEGINSADIGFDKKNKILYVPTFWKNNVVAYQLK
jgi:hypothetical protein